MIDLQLDIAALRDHCRAHVRVDAEAVQCLRSHPHLRCLSNGSCVLSGDGSLLLERNGACLPTVLTVETKSHWTIVECALSTETQSDIIQVREGSQLTYVRYDPLDCSRRDAVVAYVHENSEFQMTRIARSRAQYRVETKIVLSDRDARAVLRELNFVENGAEYTTVSDVRHEAPGTVSRVLAKNIVEGGGRSSFDGTVHVGPAAEHAVADQKNYNLLLNDASRAISIPRLKIDHPSVRCTHGATTQYLDDEILFYMSTRGIPSSRARQLFLEGFVADILDALGPLRPFFSLRSG